MNRDLEAIKNKNWSRDQTAKACSGFIGEEVVLKFLKRKQANINYEPTGGWFDSIDLKHPDGTIDVKLQTVWKNANAISLNCFQYFRKLKMKKLPDEYMFPISPFYYAKGDDFLPVPHPYNNKVMLMRTSDFNTYRPRLPMKGEGTKKRWTLKLPGTTSDNFQEYADTYRTKDQYAYYDRNLILTEIGTLNEEESKNLKEIQFLLKDLGIRDCITDYDFDPKTNKFWNKKEAI